MMWLRIPRVSFLAVVVVAAAAGTVWGQGAPAVPPVRLAVVDMDRVMSESQMGKGEQASIDRLRADKTSQISQKQKELEAQEEELRNASLSWSAEKREEHLRQYEERRIELRRMNEDATRSVQAEFQRSLARLQRAALEVTGTIGLERGYTLMFEKHSMPVLFASDSIDVTGEVIRRMDARTGAPSQGGGGS
jgi:outer membrane protein